MPRFFNTAGPCEQRKHYMLPWEERLPGVRELIDQELYFVIHAPRQVGKTTCYRHLARSLTAQGRYAALHTSCEGAQAAGGDVDAGIAAILDDLRRSAENDLPEALWPPPPDPGIGALSRLADSLTRWARTCSLPVVLFLDEIDALRDDTLVSVLRQLRSGYPSRPKDFPQSVVLIGLRDVRDYKASQDEPEDDAPGSAAP